MPDEGCETFSVRAQYRVCDEDKERATETVREWFEETMVPDGFDVDIEIGTPTRSAGPSSPTQFSFPLSAEYDRRDHR